MFIFRRTARPLSLLKGGIGALAVLLVTGCANVALPSLVFDDGPAPGSPPPAELAAPEAALTGQRPVRRADPNLAGYPNLASVPARPTAFSSPIERQALIDRLQGDRAEARSVGDEVRGRPTGRTEAAPTPVVPAGPPPVPAPVPR